MTDELDRQEADETEGGLYERCAHCGELRAAHEFEDGLRCAHCQEEQDDAEWPPYER